MSDDWAGFTFVNLPDEQAKYLQALKDAKIICVAVGNEVLAECKYADAAAGVVGDIVPLTEILHRTVDLVKIAAMPWWRGRILACRRTGKQIAEMEDAIIKNGQHSSDQDDEGIREQEGKVGLLREG